MIISVSTEITEITEVTEVTEVSERSGVGESEKIERWG